MESKYVSTDMTANINMSGCNYKNGTLRSCAPLATSYVPAQQTNPPKYGSAEALSRGTLFPGLDLPFMNIANKSNPYAGTPLGDLMSLDFVVKELNLYLDTHPNDKEVFEMMKECIALLEEGRKKYVKMYGPLRLSDLQYSDHYNWLHDPWPWDYRSERKGAR